MHQHTDYKPQGHSDEELIEALEPDQLSGVAAKPFPLLELSWSGRVGLWALRIFVLVVTALVVYTFVVDVVRGR